jgi:hypothetical protein
VPEEIKNEVYKRLDSRISIILNDFREAIKIP